MTLIYDYEIEMILVLLIELIRILTETVYYSYCDVFIRIYEGNR